MYCSNVTFRIENDVYLYGVFDGHDGYKVSNFAAQRMPAELLLGQLSGQVNDDLIKETLQQVVEGLIRFHTACCVTVFSGVLV